MKSPIGPLKIAILSRNKNLYSTKRLKEEAENRGHFVRIINTVRCYMNISSKNPEIHYAGEKLPNFNAIIPRIGASITFYGTAVVRQFEMMRVFSLNESVAISRARDKLRALQLLSRKGVGMPVTGFACSPNDTDDLIKIAGNPPLVIKLLEGTQGIGVVLTETLQAAESVIESFMGLKANIMVQEFIAESSGEDLRCFVVGDKVIAAMKRTARPGEFRSNLHRGGTATSVDLTPEETKTAIQATRILGLNVAGVDIIRSKRGPLVLEVNSSPGLKGIEDASQKNVAKSIIKFIEKSICNFPKSKEIKG
ncbi:MAG: 30S ribosomal protein S6--L-glutamate ligase [Gammaproteobacteria bacterium]|jgi:ribosomal protein S6--L-glutamate ligase